MTQGPLPATLFGVPTGIERKERGELEDFLRAAWTAQYGQPPSTLPADFKRLHDVFKTGASGKRVRTLAVSLPRLPRRPATVSDEIFIAVDEHRGLVTPEGRALLDELVWMRENDAEVLSREAMLRASSMVAGAYGDWQREWLRKQLGDATLRPGTYGVVLLLLLNGSTSAETALRLPASPEQERELARSLTPVINSFATNLGGAELSAREADRLRSNWRLTEARRHLYQYVRVQDINGDAHIWVVDEEATLDALAERLAARRDLDVITLERALTAAVGAYSEMRPKLSAWGVAHERAAHTRHVLSRITARFIDERSVQ